MLMIKMIICDDKMMIGNNNEKDNENNSDNDKKEDSNNSSINNGIDKKQMKNHNKILSFFICAIFQHETYNQWSLIIMVVNMHQCKRYNVHDYKFHKWYTLVIQLRIIKNI